MPVALFELRRRVQEVIDREIKQIGTGGCGGMDLNYDQVAMAYRERTGYVQGLQRTLQIMEDMARDD